MGVDLGSPFGATPENTEEPVGWGPASTAALFGPAGRERERPRARDPKWAETGALSLWYYDSHFIPTPSPARHQYLTDRLTEIRNQHPEIDAWMGEDWRRLLTLTEVDLAVRSAYRALGWDTGPSFDDIVEATDDYIRNMGATWYEPERFLAENEAYRLAGEELRRAVPGQDYLDATRGLTDSELLTGPALAPSAVVQAAEATGETLGGDYDWLPDRIYGLYNGLTEGELLWASRDNRLVVVNVRPDVNESYVIDIMLEDGVEVSDTLDAMAHLAAALHGNRHTVLRDDGVPGPQTPLGHMLTPILRRVDKGDGFWNWIVANVEGVIGILDPTGGYEGPVGSAAWRSTYDMQQESIAASAQSAYTQELNSPLRPDQTLYAAMLSLAHSDAEAVINGTAELAAPIGPSGARLPALPAPASDLIGFAGATQQYLAAGPVAATFGEDTRGLHAEEAYERAKAAGDTRPGLMQWRDDILSKGIQILEAWEWVTHKTMLSLVDIVEAPVELVSGVVASVQEGWDGFKNAFDLEVEQHDEFADAFDMDPGVFRDTVNIAALFLGDPFNWVTPGGKGLALRFFERMTTREGVEQFLARRSTQQLFDSAVSAMTHADGPKWNWLIGTWGGTNMDSQTFFALADAAAARDRVGVETIVRNSLNDGLFLPNMGSHMRLRSSSAGLAAMARSRDEKVWRNIRTLLGNHHGNRWFDLGDGGFDQLLGLGVSLDAADIMPIADYMPKLRTVFRDGGPDEFIRVIEERIGRLQLQSSALVREARASGVAQFRRLQPRIDAAASVQRRLESVLTRKPGVQELDDEYAEALLAWEQAGKPAVGPEHSRLVAADISRGGRERIEESLSIINQGDEALQEAKGQLRRVQARLTRYRKLAEEGNISSPSMIQRLEAEVDAARETVETVEARIKGNFGAIAFPKGMPHPSSVEYRRLADATRDYVAQWTTLKTEIRASMRDMNELARPGSNQHIVRFIHDTYDDIAERINEAWRAKRAARNQPTPPGEEPIPVLMKDGEEVLNPITGRPAYDWSIIRGTKRGVWNPSDEGDYFTAMFGANPQTATKEIKDAFREIGLFRMQSHVAVPASPQEIVAFFWRDDNLWRKIMVPTPALNDSKWQSALTHLQKFWAMQVLMNPRTFIRSNLDEPLRDIITRGRFFGDSIRHPFTLEGATGVDAAGQLVSGRISSPVLAAGKRIAPPLRNVSVDDLAAAAAAAARSQGYTTLPWRAGKREVGYLVGRKADVSAAQRAMGATVSYRGRSAHLDASRQWFNGVLGRNPMIRAYAQAKVSGDMSIWYKWWDQGGELFARRPVIRLTPESTSLGLTPERVFDSLNDGLRFHMTRHSDMDYNAMLRAWATGDEIPNAVLRKAGAVDDVGMTDDLSDKIFQLTYGSASSTHHGELYAAHYSDALSILHARLTNNGRLITPAKLVEAGVAVNEQDALLQLSRASQAVKDYARRNKFYTPGDLDAAARRYARLQADHVMYHAGATSLLGQRAQQFFPFGPAMTDYWTWYAKELSKGIELGLNPTMHKYLRQIPGLRNIADNADDILAGLGDKLSGVPLLGRTNLRMAGRVADMLAAGNATFRTMDEEGKDDLGSLNPMRIIADYTFFPVDVQHDFWLEISPSMGMIPNFLAHALPVEADPDARGFTGTLRNMAVGFRDFLETVMPSMEFQPYQTDFLNPWDYANFVFPDSSRSIGRYFRVGAGNWLAAFAPGAYLDAQGFINSRSYRRTLRRLGAQVMTEDPWIARGGDDWDSLVQTLLDNVALDSAREDTGRFVEDYLLLGELDTFLTQQDDSQFIDGYAPIMDILPDLRDWDQLPQEKFDLISDLWEAYQSGDMTRAQATQLADELSTLLFEGLSDEQQDWLVALNPGMAWNMITNWYVSRDAPAEYRRGDKLVVMPGEDGREVRERGRNEGWLIERDPVDMVYDAWGRWASAVRGIRTYIWRRATATSDDPDGVGWREPEGDAANRRVALTQQDVWTLQQLGIEVPGVHPVTGEAVATRGELYTAINYRVGALSDHSMVGTDQPAVRAMQLHTPQLVDDWEYYWDWYEDEENAQGRWDVEDPASWPEEGKQLFRNLFRFDVLPLANGRITENDWNRQYGYWFGSLDWRPPVPPPVEDLEGNGPVFRARAIDVQAIDGDTVQVRFASSPFSDEGWVRIRLVGVNAVESPIFGDTTEYLRQTARLQEQINNASEVVFGVIDPDLYRNIVQDVDSRTGEWRFLLTMYLDGVPVFDPSIFTSTNPAGAALGGTGVPIITGEAT